MKKVFVLASIALALSSGLMAQAGAKDCCAKKDCCSKKKGCDKKDCAGKSCSKKATKTVAKPAATPTPAAK